MRTMLRRWLLGLLLGLALTPASAAPVALSDEELAEVVGQGMLALSNSSYGGYEFMRITLSADVSLSATLSGVRLGEYSLSAHNGTGADIDIGTLNHPGFRGGRLV